MSEDLEAIIAPKRSYTAAEHEAAWLRYILDQVREHLGDLVYYVEDSPADRRISPDEAIRRLSTIIYPEGDAEPWWAPLAQFSRAWIQKTAESAPHCGDCVCVPARCFRCIVDEYYGVETRVWESKYVGAVTFQRYWKQKQTIAKSTE